MNGIHAEDTQDAVVTGSAIEDCGNWPIISKGSSNNWVVTENSWRKNRFATVSLANDDNLVAFNSSG